MFSGCWRGGGSAVAAAAAAVEYAGGKRGCVASTATDYHELGGTGPTHISTDCGGRPYRRIHFLMRNQQSNILVSSYAGCMSAAWLHR